jgi:adenylate kinase family enzyme
VRGTSGSGKTTLAKAISSVRGIPHVELDGIYHQRGWTPLHDDEFVERVNAVSATPEWVVCGNYRQVSATLLDRADTVVLYDLPRWLVMWRVVTRSLSRAVRNEELWNGNREGWRNLASLDPQTSIIAWAWTTHERRHLSTLELLERPPNDALRLVHLTSAAAERHFYRWLEAPRSRRSVEPPTERR